MTRQEEIREGVEGILAVLYNFHLNGDGYAKKVIEYLDSEGIVIKVERELPIISLEEAAKHDASEPWCSGNFTDSLQEFGRKAQRSMLEAGYVAVEPLIEGVKDDE